jgi:DNA topoisomerase II
MVLFDPEGRIKHYSSPEEIVAEFFELRLDMYERRRQALLRVRITLA